MEAAEEEGEEEEVEEDWGEAEAVKAEENGLTLMKTKTKVEELLEDKSIQRWQLQTNRMRSSTIRKLVLSP